jgi:hypothetical protein
MILRFDDLRIEQKIAKEAKKKAEEKKVVSCGW